jgi:hypothetical protein
MISVFNSFEKILPAASMLPAPVHKCIHFFTMTSAAITLVIKLGVIRDSIIDQIPETALRFGVLVYINETKKKYQYKKDS